MGIFQQLTNDVVVCSSGFVQNPQYISAHGCQIIFRYFGNEPREVRRDVSSIRHLDRETAH
jgi:hypothetical protein